MCFVGVVGGVLVQDLVWVAHFVARPGAGIFVGGAEGVGGAFLDPILF